MAHRIAKSLDRLRSQVNAWRPNRSKKSDGWIGDTRHSKSKSEHNPDPATGVVRALDITHDPANGLHARELAESLIASRDPRILYIISEGQMCRSYKAKDGTPPWTWTKYTGKNGHFHHVHISVSPHANLYDDTADWSIDGENVARATFPDASPEPSSVPPAAGSGEGHPERERVAGGELLRKGSRGDSVKRLQTRLGITADGIFGAATEREVKAFQKQKGLTPDGIVGTATWSKLLLRDG